LFSFCSLPLRVQILSTFGDLALVLGDNFEKYLETVKRMLSQAMHLSVMQVRQSTMSVVCCMRRPLALHGSKLQAGALRSFFREVKLHVGRSPS
jgi:hypothetical protein